MLYFCTKFDEEPLKRIDKLFNKGIEFYLNPKPIIENKEASIFFRKDKFNLELNIGAKKIVNEFKNIKISLSAISKLADVKLKRSFPIYSVSDDSFDVATEIRKNFILKKLIPN